MDLEEYIVEREFTTAKMARDLQCSLSYLRALMKKRVRAGYMFAKKIDAYTRGKVKTDDIMTWELKKPPGNRSRGKSEAI